MMLTRRGAFGMAALLGLVERSAAAAPARIPGPAFGPWLHGETITCRLDVGAVDQMERTLADFTEAMRHHMTAPAAIPDPPAPAAERCAPPGWDTLENVR